MGPALRASYGVADLTASHGGPFSYKTYLSKLLNPGFWGDEVVLWSVLMMWGFMNSKTLQEYRFHHNVALWHVDVGWSIIPVPTTLQLVSQASGLLYSVFSV